MSSFNKILNEKKQFIISIKVIRCPIKKQQYKDGTVQKLLNEAPSKRALIDTGASHSCISEEYADELELIPIGQSNMTTASNVCTVNRYKVDFAIPVANTILQPIKENGRQIMKSIIVEQEYWAHTQRNINSIPAIEKDRGFDFILGMDILSQMHITIFHRQIIMSF